MNNWIKVDAEHMPQDGELVMVTIQNDGGKRCVLADNRWDSLNNRWEWLCEASAGYWETLHDTVTHWMPYPDPAQD